VTAENVRPSVEARPPRRSKTAARLWKLAAAIAATLAAKTWGLDSYGVKEQSMWPALEGGADHVVVDKTAGRRGAIGRWDLVVVRKDGKALIKRALSTGGERLTARGGDLFVRGADDALERAARPEDVVETMRVPVYPSERASGAAGVVVTGGTVRDLPHGGLTFEPSDRVLRAALRSPGGGDDGAVRDDFRGADGRLQRGRDYVADVRVVVEAVRLAEGASFTMTHQLRGESRRVRVDGAGVHLETTEEGTPPRATSFRGASAGDALRMETLDGRFQVAVRSGGAWKELFAEPRATESFPGASILRFSVEGGMAHVGRLVVSRDAHYVEADGRDPPPGGWAVPAGELFLVGDNVPVSTDSRIFGTVSPHEVIGRVVGVWRPPAWAR
jgi:hypothetical protein